MLESVPPLNWRQISNERLPRVSATFSLRKGAHLKKSI